MPSPLLNQSAVLVACCFPSSLLTRLIECFKVEHQQWRLKFYTFFNTIMSTNRSFPVIHNRLETTNLFNVTVRKRQEEEEAALKFELM